MTLSPQIRRRSTGGVIFRRRGNTYKAAFRRFGLLSAGFTLIEVMVATAIVAIMLSLLIMTMGQLSDVWRKSSAKIESFQSARLAFDLITRNMSQATLNTYLDYDDRTRPTRYLRRSELQFVCLKASSSLPSGGKAPGVEYSGTSVFFQAPCAYTAKPADYGGMDQGLNACGYFIDFGPDVTKPSHATGPDRYRYRLMQLLVPVEKNKIYSLYPPTAAGLANSTQYAWFQDFVNLTAPTDRCAHPVSDNIILLLVQPMDPAQPALFQSSYEYNSRADATSNPQSVKANQLAPIMGVTLVAIDETSAGRMTNGSTVPEIIGDALDTRFINPAQLETDLKDMETFLIKKNVNYRIFRTFIPMRESKWTK
ncbi:MAG: Verru_Chthon cassette protein C [Candidatus Methylacidiphilales bacterium]